MAGMKSWLEKIKNRILKKDLNDNLLESKIQSKEKIAKEVAKEKELPDLITPTSEEINKEKDEIQREEAIRVKEMHEREINRVDVKKEFGELNRNNKKSSIETRPYWTKRSNPNRWMV